MKAIANATINGFDARVIIVSITASPVYSYL